MPATPKINLLQRKDLEQSPLGRMTQWAVTYGRYIMIGTEIVVLLAFISRFSLDRKLTDLKEEIGQKQSILKANAEFEKEFRQTQDRISKVFGLIDGQDGPSLAIALIQSMLPPDLRLESFEMSDDKMTMNATAGSTEGFSQFLTNLQNDKQISNIDIAEIKKQPLIGIQFRLTAEFNNKKLR